MEISGVCVFCLQLLMAANAEWIVTHTGLPQETNVSPKSFLLTLAWQGERPNTNISLSLKRSEAVERRVPVHSVGENGCPRQTSLASLKHSTFYHDISRQASISLTSFTGEDFMLQGSFLLNDEMYNVEPFHPSVHKRSLSANSGDHIITKRVVADADHLNDALMPPKGSHDWKIIQKQLLYLEQRAEQQNTERYKRQTLPSTTYIIQLYLIVDYYLYNTLTASANRINWAGGADDYVAFVMSHQASEIDVRYRSIDSSVDPVLGSWTIGTKLSHLLVAKTSGDSPWTHPPTDAVNLKIKSDDLLNSVTKWMKDNSASLPNDADHYMLITSLDLTYGGSSGNIGLAWVGGVCGENAASVNEFGGTTVLAHELGHNMGASHDGDTNNCTSTSAYVMAASSGLTSNVTRSNPWKFSSCSVNYMDTFITAITKDNDNCLANPGDYVSTWADDYKSYVGQSIPADEQCKLIHGSNHKFATSQFSRICHVLWCTSDGSSLTAKRAAMPYTTCGNHRWCVEEVCVEDPKAPYVNEACPFGEVKGVITGEEDVTCADINNIDCWSSGLIRDECCLTCPKLTTPWLGPNCTYGDRHTGCAGFTNPQTQCGGNEATCCQTCCEVKGADAGYSCTAPTTTTAATTTTIIGAVDTTTTGASTTTITGAAETTTTAVPATTETTLATAEDLVTDASTTVTVMTKEAVVTHTTATVTLTTAVKGSTSTTAVAPATTKRPRRGFRRRLFRVMVHIVSFARVAFNCRDPDLQDKSSSTYTELHVTVCVSFVRWVRRIKVCGHFTIGCGSIIVNTTLEVQENDNDSPAEAAPKSTAELLQQISGIMNDSDLVVNELPTVQDVDECADPNMNNCSANAVCTNTDGHYTCACNAEYPSDLSEYEDELGRVCAKSCDTDSCSTGEVCEERAEDSPTCVCTGAICGTWIYAVIGVSVGVVLIAVIVVVVVLVKRSNRKASVKPSSHRSSPSGP